MMQERIVNAITEALTAAGVTDPVVELTVPHDSSHGDYATNAALMYAKQLGVPPREIAEKVVTAVQGMDGVETVAVAGPGFVNVTLTNDVLGRVVSDIHTERDVWGRNTSYKGVRTMVEYTDPNPFKEFHIGHLMSNAIGESIARHCEYAGMEVRRANWQGDVGPHVAKAIWGKMQKPELSWGQAYVYGAENYDTHKDEINIINKKVYEKNDEDINRLYAEGREQSLAHFEDIYKTLGTKFDYYFFEGIEGLEGSAIVREYLKKGVFEESEGAVVFPGEQYGLHTRVFLNSQGLPTYEAKELGLNKAKFEKEPQLDVSLIITANEQSEYFKVVLKAMEFIFPDIAAKTQHIAHGMMRFAEGKMSSRKGNVVTGESLITDITDVAKERAAESRSDNPEQLAEQIAVAAIKFQVLKGATTRDIVFDRERALSLEGDSGPYVQYAYARAKSVIAAAEEAGVVATPIVPATEGERMVARLLIQFPDVVARSQQDYAPHHTAQYAGELAALYNSWYAQERVVGDERAGERLALTQAVAVTLKNALWLLGIQAPERM